MGHHCGSRHHPVCDNTSNIKPNSGQDNLAVHVQDTWRHFWCNYIHIEMKEYIGIRYAVMAWVAILVVMSLFGGAVQWILFGSSSGGGWGFLLRWPILWIIYFYASISFVEQITRRITRSGGRNK